MIYIHIPFCHRKCSYCAFYSKVTGDQGTVEAYVGALRRELQLRRHAMEGPVKTLYFGGGTPSLLTPGQLRQIVDTLRDNYDLTALEECTLEANPEDLTPAYLAVLGDMGIFNRISIGIQSFRDEELRLLNRRHSAAQAREAVENAAKAGFGNISIDLIYSIPGQSAETWEETLEQAAELPIKHLSAYALTVEPGTILERQIAQGRVAAVDDDMAVEHYRMLRQWTQDQGFEQYEISNFARQGYRSRHNSRYWNRTPYLGVGASAHSFDGEYRRWNVADVQEYCTLSATGRVPHEEEQLTLRDAHNEYLMTALRTVEGIDKSQVLRPFAKDLDAKIKKYIAAGLLLDTPTHYRPTEAGLLHADGIAAELFA